jgi:hypothetical protein
MKLVFQLHRFAIDAAHSKTIFSAAGVFNVDRELLLAVIYSYFFMSRHKASLFSFCNFSPQLQQSSIYQFSCSPVLMTQDGTTIKVH